MTRNRRYEAYYDAREDRRVAEAPTSPTTLPTPAYGPHPLVWAKPSHRPPVWAWITWPDRPAERVAAFAKGWNDRVVIVEWSDGRGSLGTVVWRNAVRWRIAGRR